MPYQPDENEIGALWVKTSAKGNEFMSGKINGVDVVCFRAKQTSDKSPTWRVLKSTPREERQPVERRPSRVDDIESDDIGF